MKEALNFILILGIIIHALLLLLSWKDVSKNRSKQILCVLFGLNFCICLHFYAQLHDFDILFLLTFLPADLVEWIIGPLLLLYVKSIFKEKNAYGWKEWRHFLPVTLVFSLISVPVFISILIDKMLFPYLSFLINHVSIYVFLRDLFFLFYLGLTWQVLSKIKNNLSSYYSSDRAKEFAWIRYLLLGGMAIMILDITTEILELTLWEVDWDTGYVTVVAMVFLFVYLGYYGVNQSSILLPDFLWIKKVDFSTMEKESHIDQILEQKLKETMSEKMPFLDKELTLHQLAILVDTTDKKLSYLLNQQMKTNFYDFINGYRILHFIQLLKTDKLKQQTLFSIAEESGFKSKSTFNRIFKKRYHCTPSEYVSLNLS